MARVTIAHKADLTAEDAFVVFDRHFGDKYETYRRGFGRTPRRCDFAIKKGEWTAVTVRLKQQRDTTSFDVLGFAPTLWSMLVLAMGLVLGGILVILMPLVGLPSWLELEDEVELFIKEAAEFK